jgi:hypothetical protein
LNNAVEVNGPMRSILMGLKNRVIAGIEDANPGCHVADAGFGGREEKK